MMRANEIGCRTGGVIQSLTNVHSLPVRFHPHSRPQNYEQSQGRRKKGTQLATYTVTKVRRERSADGTHRHLEGVITSTGTHYTRRQVADSINVGNTWVTSAGASTAIIHTLRYCPARACIASPYLATNPDSTKLDNLENLPEG
ncbi:DUF3892 domain-containing protein [Microbacterium panaciterrae]|uniref:DUF3892 domain-containing protein n=1 Tax=Microbacterium panaciterrae TaxID=985759 RepID=A0ABP8P6H4_9MICO